MVTVFSPSTLGRQVKRLDIGDFIVTEAAQKPLSVLPRHAHELASITFELRGLCEETIDGRLHKCVPYTAIIKPPGQVHSDKYCDTGTTCMIVEVKSERLQSIRSFSRLLDDPLLLVSDSMASLTPRIYKEVRIGDSASRLSIEGLVLEVLGDATRDSSKSPSAQPRWLIRAKELCHDQFDQSISLLSIAKAVGVHPAHLARKFRQHFNCTVGEFLRRVRLNHATRELRLSDKPVVQIAAEAGFYDQSHFNRSFKLHVGMTPTEYRSETQGKSDNS